MPQFKTIRGQALYDSPQPIDLKLALAAADYQFATRNPEFVAEYGDVVAFQQDLFFFTELYWSTYKKRPQDEVPIRRRPRD